MIWSFTCKPIGDFNSEIIETGIADEVNNYKFLPVLIFCSFVLFSVEWATDVHRHPSVVKTVLFSRIVFRIQKMLRYWWRLSWFPLPPSLDTNNNITTTLSMFANLSLCWLLCLSMQDTKTWCVCHDLIIYVLTVENLGVWFSFNKVSKWGV